jgi:hypothetical protein
MITQRGHTAPESRSSCAKKEIHGKIYSEGKHSKAGCPPHGIWLDASAHCPQQIAKKYTVSLNTASSWKAILLSIFYGRCVIGGAVRVTGSHAFEFA